MVLRDALHSLASSRSSLHGRPPPSPGTPSPSSPGELKDTSRPLLGQKSASLGGYLNSEEVRAVLQDPYLSLDAPFLRKQQGTVSPKPEKQSRSELER